MPTETPDPINALIADYVAGVQLPPMRRVVTTSHPRSVEDLDGEVATQMQHLLKMSAGPAAEASGRAVAVGVGSRGIANLAAIVRVVVRELQDAGYEPFIVPAMGSHGGATPEGQRAILAGYGITEEQLGVPVRATMDTVVIGHVDGAPVHLDRHVAEAGRAVLVSRVKPHTDFHGQIESGAAKMAAIGLGKRRGAETIHRLGVAGLQDLMPRIGRFTASRFLLGAIAVVENEFDQTAVVRALAPADIGGPGEQELLALARGTLPRLPVEDVDVLVVDEMGKDISGVGLDPNVTGRWLVNGLGAGMEDQGGARVRVLVALRLTPASHGNAIGLGLADFVPAQLADQIDRTPFYLNVLTSGWAGLQRGRMPIVLPTDRDTVMTAVAACGRPEAPRVVRIRNTLDTRTCEVSEALWAEIAARPDLDVAGPVRPWSFDESGRLRPLAGS